MPEVQRPCIRPTDHPLVVGGMLSEADVQEFEGTPLLYPFKKGFSGPLKEFGVDIRQV